MLQSVYDFIQSKLSDSSKLL